METLGCANPNFKVVWSISHIKPDHRAAEFKKVNSRMNPKDFAPKHLYELIEEDTVNIIGTNRHFSQPEDS